MSTLTPYIETSEAPRRPSGRAIAGAAGRTLRLPADRGDRIAVLGLLLVLAVAGILRIIFMAAWGPAFMGFPDALAYVAQASGPLWADPTHEAGYAIFLRDLHSITGQLWVPILLQHVFGLLSAVFVWLAVRRAGGPAWLGLLPAAVVALNGGEMFLEHSTLSESPYILLLAIGMYLGVRSLEAPGRRWAVLAGVTLALACMFRVVALPLVGVLLVWLVLCSSGAWRLRLRSAATAGACVALMLAAYAVIQHQQTGYWGLTTPAGAWNLYTRVAPFADCTKFTPPRDTGMLCERTPPERRTATVADYAYSEQRSPAVREFSWGDGPYSAIPADNDKLARFTRAAIVHQPGDYLKAVVEGMVAYVRPTRLEFRTHDELGYGYELFFHRALFDAQNLTLAAHKRLPFYGLHSFTQRPGLMRFLFGYERRTRVDGVLMAALMILSFFSLFAPRGRARQIGTLMFLLTWVALIVPPATHWWEARYGIAALGTLSSAAAIGAWQVGRLLSRAPSLLARVPAAIVSPRGPGGA